MLYYIHTSIFSLAGHEGPVSSYPLRLLFQLYGLNLWVRGHRRQEWNGNSHYVLLSFLDMEMIQVR